MKRSINLSVFWNLDVLGSEFLFRSTFELGGRGNSCEGSWALRSINIGGMWVGPFWAAPLFILSSSSTLRTFAREHAKEKTLSLLCPHCSAKHVQVSSLLCSVSPASQSLSYSKYNLSCHWESGKLSLCWYFMENGTPFVAFSHFAKDPEKREKALSLTPS